MHLGTRALTLSVDGVSRTADVSACRLVSVPLGSRAPLGEPDAREYHLVGVAAQDVAAGSLWDLVWDHVNELVDVEIRPAGGTVISATQPAFSGQVWITEPEGDLLGGAANASVGGRFTFEFDWTFTAKPERLTEEPA
jgi:hypothetical protein